MKIIWQKNKEDKRREKHFYTRMAWLRFFLFCDFSVTTKYKKKNIKKPNKPPKIRQNKSILKWMGNAYPCSEEKQV